MNLLNKMFKLTSIDVEPYGSIVGGLKIEGRVFFEIRQKPSLFGVNAYHVLSPRVLSNKTLKELLEAASEAIQAAWLTPRGQASDTPGAYSIKKISLGEKSALVTVIGLSKGYRLDGEMSIELPGWVERLELELLDAATPPNTQTGKGEG